MLMLWLMSFQVALAQAVDEDQVKAAYIYNFARFVDWNAMDFETSGPTFQICIWKDSPLETALAGVIKGKQIGGRPIVVKTVKLGQTQSCRILFISSEAAQNSYVVLRDVNRAGLLTVGEVPDFLDQGGMINLVVQGDRIRFDVSYRAAKNARLHISSRMLSLANRVIQ
jgi:hypothetical protein